MSDSPSLIMIQFLSWVADRPRSYAETMDAWRTTCPRLSVWEDAVIACPSGSFQYTPRPPSWWLTTPASDSPGSAQ